MYPLRIKQLKAGDIRCIVERTELWFAEATLGGSMEPITLAVVSAVVVTEGIKFMYCQAGELLRGRRERRNDQSNPPPVTLEASASDLFEGTVQPVEADFTVVERFQDDLGVLRQALSPYADDIKGIDPGDRHLMETADALRKILEAVYGQRLTFKGEIREPSGPVVFGRAQVDEIAGDVAGVRAQNIREGHISGEVVAKEVETGGAISGVEVRGDIG